MESRERRRSLSAGGALVTAGATSRSATSACKVIVNGTRPKRHALCWDAIARNQRISNGVDTLKGRLPSSTIGGRPTSCDGLALLVFVDAASVGVLDASCVEGCGHCCVLVGEKLGEVKGGQEEGCVDCSNEVDDAGCGGRVGVDCWRGPKSPRKKGDAGGARG